MRITEISGIRDENGKIPLSVTLKNIFNNGFGWQSELDSQDQISDRLGAILSDEFVLLKGVQLPGLDTPIPMVLIGPPGIYVMYASSARGTYRARGDVWLVMDGSGNMKSAKPNLPTRTRLYAEAIRKFLLKHGHQFADIEAVLLFSRNDAFVENIKAPIRVVLSDGVENYTSSLRLQHPILTPEECNEIRRLLTDPEGKKKPEAVAAPSGAIEMQQVVMPTATSAAAPAQEDSLQNMFAEAAEGPYISVFDQEAPVSESKPAPGSSPLARLGLKRSQFLILLVAGILDCLTIILILIVVLPALLPHLLK